VGVGRSGLLPKPHFCVRAAARARCVCCGCTWAFPNPCGCARTRRARALSRTTTRRCTMPAPAATLTLCAFCWKPVPARTASPRCVSPWLRWTLSAAGAWAACARTCRWLSGAPMVRVKRVRALLRSLWCGFGLSCLGPVSCVCCCALLCAAVLCWWAVQAGDTCLHLAAYLGSPVVLDMLLGYDGESAGAACIDAQNEVRGRSVYVGAGWGGGVERRRLWPVLPVAARRWRDLPLPLCIYCRPLALPALDAYCAVLAGLHPVALSCSLRRCRTARRR
jgi:hypothetical protein